MMPFNTNRAEKRESKRKDRAFIKEIEKHSDETRPLVYHKGYRHAVCDGLAERPSNWAAGAFCQRCNHTIPVEETITEAAWERSKAGS